MDNSKMWVMVRLMQRAHLGNYKFLLNREPLVGDVDVALRRKPRAIPVIGLQLITRKIINGIAIKIDFSCSVIFA
jgi:hypothetical protein